MHACIFFFNSTHSPVITASVATGTFSIQLHKNIAKPTATGLCQKTKQNKTARVKCVLLQEVIYHSHTNPLSKCTSNTVLGAKTKAMKTCIRALPVTELHLCDSVDRHTGGLTYLLMIFRSRLKSILYTATLRDRDVQLSLDGSS